MNKFVLSVTWLKDGRVIDFERDAKKFAKSCYGTELYSTHELLVKNADESDAGVYVIECEGKTNSAKLMFKSTHMNTYVYV